jgi:hypothetical protein
MPRLHTPFVIPVVGLVAASLAFGQNAPSPAPAAEQSASSQTTPVPIPANAPKMSRETRLQVIRDFVTQIVYAHVPFPMGTLGLKLRNGEMTPSREELQQAMAIYGPSVKQGDPAQITLVQIKNDHIRFELNGGPVHKKKWYEHIEIDGANNSITPSSPESNAHGSFVELDFDGYVPELSVAQLRALLGPVLDFNARSKQQAYLDTVPPKAKEAILQHRVLVGMDTDMVLAAKGKPPKKVREHEGEVSYEEWIYGEPPADVDFVRIVGEEVVQVKTMRMGGEKIVRTEKEVEIEEKPKEAKEEEKPANAPTMMRPGEQSPDAVPGTAQDPRRQTPPVPSDAPPGGDPPGPSLVARAR